MTDKVILFAGDDPNIAQPIIYKLEINGYKVLWVRNGKVVLDLVNEIKPALIILDNMIPIMSGFEVNNALKSDDNTKTIPVIFLSTNGKSQDVNTGIPKDAEKYMVNPFRPKELNEMVLTILS